MRAKKASSPRLSSLWVDPCLCAPTNTCFQRRARSPGLPTHFPGAQIPTSYSSYPQHTCKLWLAAVVNVNKVVIFYKVNMRFPEDIAGRTTVEAQAEAAATSHSWCRAGCSLPPPRCSRWTARSDRPRPSTTAFCRPGQSPTTPTHATRELRAGWGPGTSTRRFECRAGRPPRPARPSGGPGRATPRPSCPSGRRASWARRTAIAEGTSSIRYSPLYTLMLQFSNTLPQRYIYTRGQSRVP